MNVIDFNQNNCKKFQADLDSYLNDELLVERTHEVSMHLDKCPNCREALLARQQVKERLRRAVLNESVPAGLQEKIRRSIRKPSSTNRTRWVLVAAAVITLIAAGGVLQLLNRNTPTDFDDTSAATYANVQLLNIGLDDHMLCAIDKGFANRVFTEEEMSEQLGSGFSGLIAKVKEQVPEAYRVVVGHRCNANEREFIHLILKGPQTALSLILTKKSGESFSGDKTEDVIESSGVPIHEARIKGFEIAGFETRDYLAFIVSDMSLSKIIQLASIIAPAVWEFLTSHEV